MVKVTLSSLITGQVRKTIVDNVSQSGKQAITVDGNDLISGLYMITIYKDGKPTTREIIKN